MKLRVKVEIETDAKDLQDAAKQAQEIRGWADAAGSVTSWSAKMIGR